MVVPSNSSTEIYCVLFSCHGCETWPLKLKGRHVTAEDGGEHIDEGNA
jgi:hypothetical protein